MGDIILAHLLHLLKTTRAAELAAEERDGSCSSPVNPMNN